MTTPRLAALFLPVVPLLVACGDESTRPVLPPNLRMEDVVGCWYHKTVSGCLSECFDPSGLQYSNWRYFDGRANQIDESISRFSFNGYHVVFRVDQSKTTAGFLSSNDSELVISYRRVGIDLYTLNADLELATRYTPVNLDSAFPCGTPFQLLPKPANWTLF